MKLELLIQTYGYATILLGTALEGETVLILGGLSAQQGYLDLTSVMLAAFIGGVIGDQIYFFLGRRYGTAALARRPHWLARAERVHGWFKRYRSGLILGLRFMYGLRTVTAFALGTSCVSVRRFVVLHMIGAALWAVVVGAGGYFFGAMLNPLFERLKDHQLFILVMVASAFMMAWLWGRMRGYATVR